MTSEKGQFVALLPVRDEGDIIRECLTHALTWADKIFVFDTGSVDDTYDTVEDMAKSDGRIRPIGREPVYFNENRVRGLLFETARQEMRDGDWFLRIDADEFHHVKPQDFVATRLRPGEGVVYHQYYDFRLTRSEVQALGMEKSISADREKAVADRRRNYTISVYAEPRMARYRSSMRWPVNVSFPYNAGLVSRERLPIRHYPHRDPRQLARRCVLRAIMMADRDNRANWTRAEEHHWSVGNWEEFVIDDDAPGLRHWKPGTDLAEIRQTNHMASGSKRLLQYAIYALGLPRVLDMTRDSWTSKDHPLPIRPETQNLLARKLGK